MSAARVRPGSAAALARLGETLGHRFDRPELLEEALTHPSAGTPLRADNQRLEFLGDRVLGLVIAEALLAAWPAESEGTLAPRLNDLVRRETLADVAEEIGLGQHLVLGRSENTTGGRKKKAILADAMEAVIAALYIDGGFGTARGFILARWQARIEAPAEAPSDAKSRLQEWAQARGLPPPDYAVTGQSGPDHAPMFEVEARLANGLSARGTATAKKGAEQAAAAALLARLSEGTA